MPHFMDCHGHQESDSRNYSHNLTHGHTQDESLSHSYENMDLVESLLAEIENGEYMCLVCAEDIDTSSKIWSCNVCYRVYHLSCIRKWAEKSFSDNNIPTTEQKSWKCPSCSTPVNTIPSDYRCWCSKEINPLYDGIAPHSCGQTCAVSLSCPHRCMAICHPGPHPECTALGPPVSCFCMKKSKQLPCVLTNYQGWQCDSVCGETLPCGIHTCKKQCHRGLCGDCTELVNTSCYCGNTEKKIVCSSMDPKESVEIADSETGETKSWIGFFKCEKLSKGFYDCGVHQYELECEKKDKDTFKCPKQPKYGESCPCGKSKVISLLGHDRSTCAEDIPSCGAECGKLLGCGHKCKSLCHKENCPPCTQATEMKCRCSHSQFSVSCKSLEAGFKPTCTRRCTGMLHCRRHRCTTVCCEFEMKANKHGKAATWGKGYHRHSKAYDELVEKEYAVKHSCDKPCNTVLNCGKHTCQKNCHVEPCGTCLDSFLDDISCPCGRTVLRGPVRCGTIMPTCPHPCTRPYICGHIPATTHPCHSDESLCDPCRKLVTKPCACGKNQSVPNIPCYKQSASCGQLCGKPMVCGHPCPKMCHAATEPSAPSTCETRCLRVCRRKLPCGHLHVTSRCHYPKPCLQMQPLGSNSICKETVVISCKCGEIKKKALCKGLSEDHGTSSLILCEERCQDAQRRRELADAFGLELTLQNEEFKYTNDIVELYLSKPRWSMGIENKVRQFSIAHANQDNSTPGKGSPPMNSLKFPPMRSSERKFIHELASAYGLRSQAFDREPKRNVVVFTCGETSTRWGVDKSKPVDPASDGDPLSSSSFPDSLYVPRLTIGQYIKENNVS